MTTDTTSPLHQHAWVGDDRPFCPGCQHFSDELPLTLAPISMTTDTSSPLTLAGREFLAEFGNQDFDDDVPADARQWWLDTQAQVAARIHKIESEARAIGEEAVVYKAQEQAAQLQAADAQLVLLRDALEAACDYIESDLDEFPEGTYSMFRQALNSTAEDNKEAVARIREEAVKAERKRLNDGITALTPIHESDDPPGWYFDGWNEAIDKACALLTENKPKSEAGEVE